jgi:pSer/pThr/pTyr-binding forkhead associated (FHA) protein
MPRLIVKLPSGPKSVPVGEDAVTIGRTNDNTIALEGEGVSRKHVQILFVGKGHELVDMGSRNGTKVNGQKVPRAMLKPGDVILVGPVEIVFEGDGGDAGAGLDIEELDLGGAQSSAPSAGTASATLAMQAQGGPAGECVLRFVDGERKGTELALKGTRTTFGRRSSNTVTFQDSAVSGVHCEITREANGYVLRDLGSTNGTLVDGEPVVETLLRHNSRIRIGGERVLFVDPSVADIESSLAAADDGSEWGLMRGEIDVTAARGRGGKGGLVAALVVLAAAGGAAWFVTNAKAGTTEVPPVKDNRVPDWSFEDGVVRWFSPEEEGATARSLGTPEAPRGASGARSLEVQPKGDGLARVEFSAEGGEAADLTVAPDAQYEVSARVGSGTGAVIVVWVSSARPGLVREVATPPAEGGAAWPSTKAVVTAPVHATGARLQLAAFGGRAASFDDVVFRRAEGAPPPALVSSELQVRIDAGGAVEAVRGGEVLLCQGGLAPAADTPVEQLLGATLAAPPAHAGAVLSASGTLPGGAAFETKAEAVGGGAVLTCVPTRGAQGGGAGAFTFTCPPGSPRGAVTLVLARSALVLPEDDAFRQEGVRKVIVGTADGPPPFVLSAGKDSPGFVFSSKRTPAGLRIQLAPPANPPEGADVAGVVLTYDDSEEKRAAQEAMGTARRNDTLGKLGAAAEGYHMVAITYHYLPSFRKEAETARDRILKSGNEDLRTARATLKQGRTFGSAPDLEAVAALAGRLAERFEGHAIGEQAGVLRDEARADLAKTRAAGTAGRADRLYQRAQDFRENRQPANEVAILEEIIRIAPEGDEYRKRAEERLPAAKAEAEAERTALFGQRRK